MENLSQSQIHEYNEAILTRIRELCVSRKTSITKIEKALGYGNGTVSGWSKAKKKAPHDRVEAIANFLGVSSEYLETGTETKKAPSEDGEKWDDFTYAAHGYSGRLTEADKATILKMMETLAAANEEDNGQADGGIQ